MGSPRGASGQFKNFFFNISVDTVKIGYGTVSAKINKLNMKTGMVMVIVMKLTSTDLRKNFQ